MSDTRFPSNIPIPDPSLITAQEIARSRIESRDEFRTALEAQRDFLIATGTARHEKALLRIEGVEYSIVLLEKLINEKLDSIGKRFDAVQTQLRERDHRFADDKTYVAAALSSALTAQKEMTLAQNECNERAANKTEISFTKEIDGLKVLINAMREATQTDITNLTSRLDRGDGTFQGSRQTIEDRRNNANLTTVIVGTVIAFFVLLFMIAGTWISLHTVPQTAPASSVPSLTSPLRTGPAS